MGAYGGTPQASMSPSDAGNIADIDNDDSVNFRDFAPFADSWQSQQVLLPEDLDRDGAVDYNDFAIFAENWLYGEPGIEFEISPCEMGLSAKEQMDETRFTVTVEGRSIHFEDMMVANCCADELWLEMTITNNLIIIYEHEFAMFPCYCICDPLRAFQTRRIHA